MDTVEAVSLFRTGSSAPGRRTARIALTTGRAPEGAPVDHVIEGPVAGDAPAIARVLLAAWLQTYPHEEAGIDEAWIREHRGSVTTPGEIARWREFVVRAASQPDQVFCRVVRCRGEIVGFLCGRREGKAVDLGPMYLLRRAQGGGLGGRLMNAFLDWAGESPVRLWVTTYNEGAVRFYRRHGFEATGEQDLWRGRLPNMRMVRIPSPDRVT
jgi:GNAT superfamily N-acetyltransferase